MGKLSEEIGRIVNLLEDCSKKNKIGQLFKIL